MYDADDYDEEEPQVAPIHHYNPMEEAAQRYWRASSIWRDKLESDWNYGMLIQELRGVSFYRGLVSPLALNLLSDVVHDRRQPIMNLQPEQAVIPMVANDEGAA